MKKFIGDIAVEHQELFGPVVRGLESAGYEVEMNEKDKFDLNRNQPCPGEKVAMLKIFKFVHPDNI